MSTVLEVNGIRIPSAEQTSRKLRRDRVDTEFAEATYINTNNLRTKEALPFERHHRGELLVIGNFERLSLENPKARKKVRTMECTFAISVGSSYILSSKAEVLSGLSAPFLEVYVAGKGLGRPIVLTKMVHLLPRRKWIRCICLDAIPENDDNDGPRIGRSNLKSQTLEFLAEEYGGRVELAKTYYEGLSHSMIKNLGGNGLIASMEQCNDFFFLGTKHIAMGRVGDDFWFQDPNGDPMGAYWLQGVHMIHCGFNILWMGNFIQPHWDMFQSDHVCAKFHAASRAICGGPVYVSDAVGGHDFDLLKKLILPDGTILRCQHYALPTRDCIFTDPSHDGLRMLKLWNLNKFGGVVGAFNCQGSGWCPRERKIKAFPHLYRPISGSVSPKDVEWTQRHETVASGNAEEYAVYLNQSNKLVIMQQQSSSAIILQPSSFDIFTIVPVHSMKGLKFAPIGLQNMYNSGGGIQGVKYGDGWVELEVKGAGHLCAYSSKMPTECKVNGEEMRFEWRSVEYNDDCDKKTENNDICEGGGVSIDVAWVEGGLSVVHMLFFAT